MRLNLRNQISICLSTLLFLAAYAVPTFSQSGPSISAVYDTDGGAADTTGAVGQRVVIEGGAFGSSQGSSTVTFNGTSASIEGWSAAAIYTSVPAGATTGNLVVTVGGVASNGISYTIVNGPNIVYVNDSDTGAPDTTGAIGQRVAIHGGGFGTTQGSSTAAFNGTEATIESWGSQNAIFVDVPAGATTGNLVVTVGGVASNAIPYTILNRPNIISVRDGSSGASITAGEVGEPVVLQGGGFGTSQGSSTVTFNGTAATVSSWSASAIYTSIPAGATSGNLIVTVSGTASNAVSFTVVVAPDISQINDTDGGAADTTGAVGQRVAIEGGGFGSSQGSSTVTFNGTSASIEGWSAAAIYTSVPAGATTGNLVVTVGGVASNGISYTIVNGPNIVYVNDSDTGAPDTTGAIGQRVAIHGGGFGTTQGSSTAAFNGTEATIESWGSQNAIFVDVPAGATTGNLVVTVGGVASNAIPYTILNRPNIISVRDGSSGASITAGEVGEPVVLQGGGFGTSQGSSTVTFNGTAATVSSWSASAIYTSIPAGATSGNLIVTVSGTASNSISFSILTPDITSLSSNFGAPGLTITISGSSFGAAQGSSTVTFNGAAATVASWSDTAIIATVPSGAASGNVVVTVAGTASNGASFTVVAPPSISASTSPPPNASGWNRLVVTVTFTCTPGGLAIATCSSPQAVATDGANQVVTGTATDLAGDTTTASVIVNIDTTQPTLAIASPADGSTVSSSTLTVAGSLSDSLSGVSGVTCDGTAASLVSGSFSCNVTLNAGNNLVLVRSTDVAGNVTAANLHVTLTGTLSTPSSLTVTPGSLSISVADTHEFTAIDDQGRPRTDATWSVSDTSIATLATDGSGTLTGVTAGQVTLTATVQGITGQTTVTVLSGILPAGTVVWTAPAPSGFTTQQIIEAVATVNGPELYSLDSDSSGDFLIRAFKSDGEQLWQNSMPHSSFPNLTLGKIVGDDQGGILLVATGENSGGNSQLTDLDPITGGQTWQASSSTTSQFWELGDPNAYLAVGLDGTDYVVESNCASNVDCLDAFDGTTGSLKSRVQLPQSTSSFDYTACGGGTGSSSGPGSYSEPIVGPDGAVYMQSATAQTNAIKTPANSCLGITSSTDDETLALLKNGQPYQTIATASSDLGPGPLLFPSSTIPDGNGGMLVSFTERSADLSTTTSMIASTTGVSAATALSPQNAPWATTMVLGDNNAAFITDGQVVESFNPSALTRNWAYTSNSGGNLSFVATTAGGGVTVNDSVLGLIPFDSAGTAGTANGGLQGAVPFQLGLPVFGSPDGALLGMWSKIANGVEFSLDAYYDPADSVFIEPKADPQNAGAATPTASITVNFQGDKSTGDTLLFPSFRSCSQTLGLFDCPGPQTWVWNVEIAATVSDDASNWTVAQGLIGLGKGNWKDSEGGLHAFTNPFNVPIDNLGAFIQQPSGQKSIFWIDSPGHSYFLLPDSNSEPVDSLTQVENFASAVCTKAQVCKTVTWFLKLVVDSPSTLDTNGTVVGFGSTSTSF